jgi:hypothetical protein
LDPQYSMGGHCQLLGMHVVSYNRQEISHHFF